MNASMKASHIGQFRCSHPMTIATFMADHGETALVHYLPRK
jgi:hypothetical protein